MISFFLSLSISCLLRISPRFIIKHREGVLVARQATYGDCLAAFTHRLLTGGRSLVRIMQSVLLTYMHEAWKASILRLKSQEGIFCMVIHCFFSKEKLIFLFKIARNNSNLCQVKLHHRLLRSWTNRTTWLNYNWYSCEIIIFVNKTFFWKLKSSDSIS